MILNQKERIVSYSPFRVSFAGGGTDISPFCDSHGGAVINTAIDRGVTVIYTPDSYELEISSRDFLKSVMIAGERDSNDVLHKTIGLLQSRGIEKGRISINSGVPPGSGLGSSSALTTALLSIIHMYNGEKTDPWSIAREAFKIEREYFGITLGKQDPFAVSVGGFKFMEFSAGNEISHPIYDFLEFSREIERRTLLIYTGKTRESSDYLREQVVRSSVGDQEITENLIRMKKLTEDMYRCALNGDSNGFISGINTGWSLKKSLGKKVSNDKIDSIILNAIDSGAQAAKLMGGGGEGFVLAVSKPDALEKLQKKMMDYSDFVIRVSFDPAGTRTRMAPGIFP